MLEFEKFEDELMKELDKYYPEAKKTKQDLLKVNGKKRTIAIERGQGISAVIYPEELYVIYKSGENMETIMDFIGLRLQHTQVLEHKELLYNWEAAKQYLKPFVMNLEKNRDYLEYHRCIFREKLDLAYSYYVELPADTEENHGQVNVTKSLLEYWGVSEEEVFDIAEKNAVYIIKPLSEIINELLIKADFEDTDSKENLLFVLSNRKKFRGASGMFDTELLHEKSEKLQTNFYILPSSIHEVILVKEESGISVDGLKEMVQEINATCVRTEDVLSDTIYYYDRKKNGITIVG